MISEAKTLGISFGIYTSSSQWTSIMGSSYTGGSAYDLWYAHYNDVASFAGYFLPRYKMLMFLDFSAFGGWTSPAMKQYEGDQTLCSFDVDYDYY